MILLLGAAVVACTGTSPGSDAAGVDLVAPEAATLDPDVADFVARARDFWPTWKAELRVAGPDLMARGCGWPAR